MLFNYHICSLEDWGKVFQNIKIFEPLVAHIARVHDIEYSGIGKCKPGSNAVFHVGKYIFKIFAPEESGIGGEDDYISEKFGIMRANRLNIPAPRLFASGVIYDKYLFRYLILEYIEGELLADISGKLSGAERFKTGRLLRKIVDRMDIPCEKFNNHDLHSKQAEDRWKAFPPCFQRERKEYLKAHKGHLEVYVHGDLNPDNIIVKANKEICLIDFADALTGPVELELAAVICDGFKFDADYINGFIGKYDKNILTEKILYGLSIHDYGVNIIGDNIGVPEKIFSLAELRERIAKRV